ncbi:MAG TPA: 50S ribosomal protein L23 [Patescibacteria group bacterium]|nr:50S ribosomal protein L23 [Patescibacteria group bacterium]
MSKSMILKPRLSEKAYGLSQNSNVYVFQVPGNANKLTIADAVADQFDVTVLDVNIMNTKGKVKRTVRRGGRQTFGSRSNVKKAYVLVKEGDLIAIFANEEDQAEDKPAKKEKK